MTTNNAYIHSLLQYKDVTVISPCTIVAGASVSNIINSGGMRLQGLVLPSNFITADITFTVGYDSTTPSFALVTGDGVNAVAAITLKGCVASKWVELNPAWFSAVKYIIINTSAAQTTTDKIINCIFNPLYQGIHG